MGDSGKKEVPSRSQTDASPRSPITPKVVAIAAVAGVLAALLAWLLTSGGAQKASNLSREDVSATSEAVRFATGEAIRQATREVADATRTTLADVTSTAQPRQSNVAATRTAEVVQAEARKTADAPATQTIEAQEFATARTVAEATIQVLNKHATVLFGPANGSLEQAKAGEVACSAPHATLGDFAVEVGFQNPQPSVQQTRGQGWDYGVIFAAPDSDLQYRLILDSAGKWTLNLHADGFDISNSDSTRLLDSSNTGTNTLKLFVVGDTAQLYVNGNYIDTLDLNMFEQGAISDAGYDVGVCAGIQEEDDAPGRTTTYNGYTLWSLP